MATSAPVAANAGDAPSGLRSKLYRCVMTPVIFVSFLVSLAWVDLKYNILRSRIHSKPPGFMPEWMETVVYRRQPYDQYTTPARSGTAAVVVGDDGRRWYYHSKQKKLMRMEAVEAFRIRDTVLIVLGLVIIGVTWAAWRATGWALRTAGAWIRDGV